MSAPMPARKRKAWRWCLLRFTLDGKRMQRGGRYCFPATLGKSWVCFRELLPSGDFARGIMLPVRVVGAIEEIAEDDARAFVLWENDAPCSSFIEPSALPGACARCGHKLQKHEQAAKERHEWAQLQKVRERIARAFNEPPYWLDDVNPGRIWVTFDRASAGAPLEERTIFDVGIGDSDFAPRRIPRELWDRLLAAGLPILSWDAASAAWADAGANS